MSEGFAASTVYTHLHVREGCRILRRLPHAAVTAGSLTADDTSARLCATRCCSVTSRSGCTLCPLESVYPKVGDSQRHY
jgi:hypothetical protein